MGDPQVNIGFNTKSWSFMTWMIWGYPHDLGNMDTSKCFAGDLLMLVKSHHITIESFVQVRTLLSILGKVESSHLFRSSLPTKYLDALGPPKTIFGSGENQWILLKVYVCMYVYIYTCNVQHAYDINILHNIYICKIIYNYIYTYA